MQLCGVLDKNRIMRIGEYAQVLNIFLMLRINICPHALQVVTKNVQKPRTLTSLQRILDWRWWTMKGNDLKLHSRPPRQGTMGSTLMVDTRRLHRTVQNQKTTYTIYIYWLHKCPMLTLINYGVHNGDVFALMRRRFHFMLRCMWCISSVMWYKCSIPNHLTNAYLCSP